MATWTNAQLPDAQVPARTGARTTLFWTVALTAFSSSPAAADIINVANLPNGSRVVESSLYNSNASNGAATSTIQLQQKVNTTVSNLTATLAATAVGSNVQNVAPPPSDPAYSTLIQIAVATAALQNTSPGYIGVMLGYETNPNKMVEP